MHDGDTIDTLFPLFSLLSLFWFCCLCFAVVAYVSLLLPCTIYLLLLWLSVDTMTTKYLNLRFKFGGILVSEVGPIYVWGRTEYVENVDEDHLSIPELADYAMSFGIRSYYAVPSLGGDLVELKNDIDICNIALFMHDGT